MSSDSKVLVRRGNKTNLPTLDTGEFGYCLDTDELFIGNDGDNKPIGSAETGYTGSQGDLGYTGSQGSTGYVGSKGDLGYTGSKGDQGNIGYTGSQGVEGSIGYTGSQGEQGLEGYTGSQGIGGGIGYTGSQGVQGNSGYTGSQGIQGGTGYTGSQGEQGLEGYTGSQGIQGDKGDQGDIGYTGSKGNIGYTGSQGIQGGTGYTGSQGIQGNIGYTGSQGDQGDIGYTGSQGEQGVIGYTGSQGDQGDLGYTGSQGDQGNIGYTGSQGIQGNLGYTGSQGNIGYSGSQGIQGDTGFVGSKGDQGNLGYTGSAGSLGYTPVDIAGDTMIGFLTLNADPTDALHAVTKQYADAIAAGIRPKGAVIAATTEEILLYDVQTIDTVVLSEDDRVLVKNQSDLTENGIYIVKASDDWIRSADCDGTPSGEVVSGISTFCYDGDVNLNTGWVLIGTNPIDVGVDDMVFTLYNVSGELIAGNGLVKTINTLDIGAGHGITVNTDSIEVKLDGSTLSKGNDGLKVTDNTFAPYSHGHVADDVSLTTTGFSKNLDENVDDVQKLADAVDALGVTGYAGSQGNIGYTGSQGVQGNLGYTGSQGIQGDIGYTGSQGDQGDLGYTGSQGSLGYTGSQGIIGYTGSKGDIGYTGSRGDIGYTGSQGIQGDIGYTGSQGDQGNLGYTGSKGNIGYTGSQGIQGNIGYTGSQGVEGSIGYTGSQGIQGNTGYTGSQGIQGGTGYTGSQGTQGNLGYTGSQGVQGGTGYVGSKGDLGYTGSAGSLGYTPVNKVGDTMTGNLQLDNAYLKLSDPDVAHGVTAYAATDVYGYISTNSSTGGGLYVVGLTDNESADLYPVLIRGINGHASPTRAAILLEGNKANGTGIQALAASEILYQLVNRSTVVMSVLGNGNVGLGVISPSYEMQIGNPTDYTAKTRTLAIISDRTSDSTAAFASIKMIQSNAAGGNYSAIEAWRDYDNYGTSLRFYTSPNSGPGITAERMRIDRSGYVGINNTSPQNRLHVSSGNIVLDSGEFRSYGVGTENATNWESVRVGHSGTAGIISVDKAGTGTYRKLYLQAGSNTGLCVDTNGRVGIYGNTAPAYELDVSGVTQSTRFISTIAIGTAPLTVTSTTKVSNLNSDMLDSIHLHEIGVLSVYRSGKDANGVFTVVNYKRGDATLFMNSTLSGGTSPYYTTRTEIYYDTNGSTVLATKVFTISYDGDNDLLNEVLN